MIKSGCERLQHLNLSDVRLFTSDKLIKEGDNPILHEGAFGVFMINPSKNIFFLYTHLTFSQIYPLIQVAWSKAKFSILSLGEATLLNFG